MIELAYVMKSIKISKVGGLVSKFTCQDGSTPNLQGNRSLCSQDPFGPLLMHVFI